MFYAILGDLVVGLHLLWILFILCGILWAWKNPAVLWVHVGGLIFTIVLNLGGWFCPLTYLENYLYRLYDPRLAYPGSFLGQYLQKLIYLDLDEFYLRVGAIVWAMANLGGYFSIFRKKFFPRAKARK